MQKMVQLGAYTQQRKCTTEELRSHRSCCAYSDEGTGLLVMVSEKTVHKIACVSKDLPGCLNPQKKICESNVNREKIFFIPAVFVNTRFHGVIAIYIRKFHPFSGYYSGFRSTSITSSGRSVYWSKILIIILSSHRKRLCL